MIFVKVWGCGNLKAANYQQDIKKWESKQIEKMRTVKPSVGWEENADKAILDFAGVKTDHSERADI